MVAIYFFFVTTELCCLVLLRLNFVSLQTLSMLRQNLLYFLSLAELFFETLNPLLRQTCLSSSHLSSILCRDRKILCGDKNLLLYSFYYHDIDFCLQFIIMSQHQFLCCNNLLVILLTFCRDNSRLCHDNIHLNLKFSLSQQKTSMS